jgi:murein DD-endopeptidase MepM/ murein hydrolase activator NlpD
MIEEKYTLLIVPNDTRSTKRLVFNKMVISISLALIASIIGALFILYGLYSNEKRTNTSLNEINKQHKSNIELLQQEVEYKREEVDSYKEAAENNKNKMDELFELENNINSVLGGGTVKLPASRGASGLSTPTANVSIDETINRLNETLNKLKAYEITQRKVPSILPCAGNLTSEFGSRGNPFGKKSTETHEGIDIANSTGTPIKATADGTVTYSGWQSGYGNVVIINHGNGYESFYGHNSKLKISEGARVKRGDVIALMGSTGRSTGPHSHFEIRLNNTPIDPLKFIKQNTIR